ncbi:hypothetical protein BP6252_10666 [Coleophoma cylindrospora]|uniref:Uncharacterized protein n=1 Tax=Coleophoma cylindrospora TaxID=1849047 RepID=A0A3D8QTA0_9HELO|nr:hypothetical protein BP6252_10666 [Coleophoma cylindrospora]
MNTPPTPLVPLAMSQTKEDLLRRLDISVATYALMAKEAGRAYKWVTSDTRHLKKHCKRDPPYDWCDILEKSKDEAIERIANSGDSHTSYYWKLAVSTEDCPNWIARWFLYHKFRYRDGRNRNATRRESSRPSEKSGSKQNSSTSSSSRAMGHTMQSASQNTSEDQYYGCSIPASSHNSQSRPYLQSHPQRQGQSSSSTVRQERGAQQLIPTHRSPAADSMSPSPPNPYTFAPGIAAYQQHKPSIATSLGTYYEEENFEINDNTSETSSKPYYDPVRDT